MTSLPLEWLEFPFLTDSWYGEAAILVLGDIASIYELLEERCSDIAILSL